MPITDHIDDIKRIDSIETSANTAAPQTTTYTKTEVDTINTWVADDSRAKTALNASGSAPIYACRAWVNFNGTGTVAIRASGNVSSITDNGTGDYTINFLTAMEDSNWICHPTASGTATAAATGVNYVSTVYDAVARDTSSVRIKTGQSYYTASNYSDQIFINVSVYR